MGECQEGKMKTVGSIVCTSLIMLAMPSLPIHGLTWGTPQVVYGATGDVGQWSSLARDDSTTDTSVATVVLIGRTKRPGRKE